MWFLYLFSLNIIFSYVLFDVNYFLRAIYTMICCKLFEKDRDLTESTTNYGICTLRDCDVSFRTTRLCRIVRALDFARYNFYLCTGIQRRSAEFKIKSLQGSTLTLTLEPIPIFVPYKIISKLVFWDDRSLFFEHDIVTLFDGKRRGLLVSRQYATREIEGNSTDDLLRGLPGSEVKPDCPEYIKKWLKSFEISSAKLRANAATDLNCNH